MVRSLLVGQSVFLLQSQVLETLVVGFGFVEVLNIFVEGLALNQQTIVVYLSNTSQVVHADRFFDSVESDSLGSLAAKQRMKIIHLMFVFLLVAILQTLKQSLGLFYYHLCYLRRVWQSLDRHVRVVHFLSVVANLFNYPFQRLQK